MKIETIKKSQRETILEMEKLGNRSGVLDGNITNRIQEIEESISGHKTPLKTLTQQSK